VRAKGRKHRDLSPMTGGKDRLRLNQSREKRVAGEGDITTRRSPLALGWL